MGFDNSIPKDLGATLASVSKAKSAIKHAMAKGSQATKWQDLEATMELSDKIRISGFAKRKYIIYIDNVGLTMWERTNPAFGYGALLASDSHNGTLPIVQHGSAGIATFGENFEKIELGDKLGFNDVKKGFKIYKY